ncbi:MAG: hypothetical protein OXJ90_23920 [Spirochaetaceae bacterium]|nr:hypothetical protein [Spirochaetaceae bacterium]
MPLRAFAFIAFLVLIAVFSAFNLDNRSDVSLAVHTFVDVPIYISCLISFTLGALLVLPFTRRRRRTADRDGRSSTTAQEPARQDSMPRRKREEIAAPRGDIKNVTGGSASPSVRTRQRWPARIRRRTNLSDRADTRSVPSGNKLG